MKKIALLVSLFMLVIAFTAATVSAQSATPQKATTEKVAAKDGKPCCSKAEAAKAGCSHADATKAGCAKSCAKAESKGCGAKGEAKNEALPVPKNQ